MKKLFLLLFCFITLSGQVFSQRLLISGIVGFPQSGFAFANNSVIDQSAYGGSIGLEQKLSNTFSAYGTIGATFLSQKGVSDVSTIIPVMIGIKLNMGAGGFLPFIGAEIGYEFTQYDDYFLGKQTVKEAAIGVFLGLEVPLTSKISLNLEGKYGFVLALFRTNSLASINIGVAFGLN